VTAEPAQVHQPRFVVVGAYVADCLVRTNRLPNWDEEVRADSIRMAPGGKALNQAVVLARHGAYVTALGTIGNDAIGRQLLDTLEAEHIDTTAMPIREAATGICLVLSDDSARNAIVWRLSDELALTPDDIKAAEQAFHGADCVLITFEIPPATAAEAITAARRHGARVIVNPAPPPSHLLDLDTFPWADIDVLVPNESEARALLPPDHPARTGPAEQVPAAVAAQLAVSTVCVTLADRGCVLSHEGRTISLPATEARVVDTTGAGDTFLASLSYHWTRRAPVAQCVTRATSAAGATVSRTGAFDALPGRGELRW
jgi:ribokinase